jgi:hypothetical protein
LDEENEEDLYPEASGSIGFIIEEEDSEFSLMRRVLVEHGSSLENSHISTISEWVEKWFQLLERGGFAMPFKPPPEADSFGGTVSQFDDFTIEIPVDRFEASEAAWNCLFNLLEVYSTRVRGIAKVTVE